MIQNALETEQPELAKLFDPFKDAVKVRFDKELLVVESKGMPAHPMMIGITAWQQQLPRQRDTWIDLSNLMSWTEQHGSFNYINQLANISRPVKANECFDCLLATLGSLVRHASAEIVNVPFTREGMSSRRSLSAGLRNFTSDKR